MELTELKHILRKTQQFFEEQDQMEGGPVGQHQQLIADDGSAAPTGKHFLAFHYQTVAFQRHFNSILLAFLRHLRAFHLHFMKGIATSIINLS